MTWAQRLHRVFRIDLETCNTCGGVVRVIASVEDPVVIEKILAHLHDTHAPSLIARRPEPRAPPGLGD